MLIDKIEWKKILILLGIFLGLELLSYFSFFSTNLHLIVFLITALSFLVLSLYKLQYALLAIFAELIIGSMGHLFFLEISNFRLSLRISFWLIILVVFLIKFISQLFKEGKLSPYLQKIKDFKFLKVFLLFSIFLVIALVQGLVNTGSFSSVFKDFNAWLFFLLLFPLVAVFDFRDQKFISSLKVVILAALIWLSLKTLIFLAIFSHSLDIGVDVYPWLRKNLMAEVTISGFWSRIFIQSQIFSAIGFLFTFCLRIFKKGKFFTKDNLITLLLSALFFSTLILSLSRSFWLAFVVVIFLMLIYFWRFLGFKKVLLSIAWLFASLITSLVLIYLVTILPLSASGNASLNKGLIDRITQDNEPALASRWSLLPVLWQEIVKAPILGSGFGSKLTYISQDPRVLEVNPSGEYSTSAFEWGYLDMWFKLGLIGLLVYLFLIFKIFIAGFKDAASNNGIFIGISFSILFLAIVHFFTPYLNHPLGISILMLSACIIQENKVYLNTNKNNN